MFHATLKLDGWQSKNFKIGIYGMSGEYFYLKCKCENLEYAFFKACSEVQSSIG